MILWVIALGWWYCSCCHCSLRRDTGFSSAIHKDCSCLLFSSEWQLLKKLMENVKVKKKYWLEDVSLLFRGLVHCYHGEKHGNMQADMVLKKELRVVQFDPQATGSELCTPRNVIWTMETLKPTPQWHTSSNKAAPAPTNPHLLIVPLPLATIFCQTITLYSLATKDLESYHNAKIYSAQLQKSL